MTTEDEKLAAWDLETGLPNDIDAYIKSPKFGFKDEYKQTVIATTGDETTGLMFIADLVDETGELLGSQGWSVGTGWILSDDGLSISHPKRKNVVNSSMYGQLQRRVIKDIGVNMGKYGLPTHAMSWDKLGFHWMLEEHPTVGGTPKQGLMPTEFLGELEFKAASGVEAKAAQAAVVSDTEKTLVGMAKSMDVKAFQKAAVRMPEVAANDELMVSVLDEGPDGFWAKHQG